MNTSNVSNSVSEIQTAGSTGANQPSGANPPPYRDPIFGIAPLGRDRHQFNLTRGPESQAISKPNPEPSTQPLTPKAISNPSVTKPEAPLESNTGSKSPSTPGPDLNPIANSQPESRNDDAALQQKPIAGEPAKSEPAINSELSSPNCLPRSTVAQPASFPRSRGETARAYSGFVTYFSLGHGRTLQAVADKLGEQLPTVKNWSSKYDWTDRIQQFTSGALQKQIDAEEEARQKAAADWAKRNAEYRELEWEAGQKLLEVVRCWFENYGERDIERMRLSELSRAVVIASKMSHSALRNTSQQDKPARSPLQDDMLAFLKKMPSPSASPSNLPQP